MTLNRRRVVNCNRAFATSSAIIKDASGRLAGGGNAYVRLKSAKAAFG